MTTPESLTPDDVDLLLSAELDDDLDAAAADLGLGADEARARLAVTPGVTERRAAFAAAHAASRTPEPLPDAVRARVVRMAQEPAERAGDDLAARRQEQTRRESAWGRRLIGAGAVAAALLLVVGIVAVLGGSGDDDGDSGDLSAADALEVKSFGDLTTEERLRDALASDGAPGDERALGEAPSDANGDAESGEGFASDSSAPDASPMFRLRASVVECTAILSDQLAGGSPPIAQGTATYDGDPAGLALFDLDGRRFAVVFDPSSCEPRKTLLGPP